MAIATRNEGPTVNIDPVPYEQQYDTITTDAISAAVKCSSKDLEGSPLETTYYVQRLGRDDKFSFQDQHLSPSYQSYIKLSGLVVNVIEAIDYDIDPETGMASGEGVALLLPFMKFNPGDMFYSNAVNGERTLFRVTSATLSTVHRGSPYRIKFTMVGPITDSSPQYIDLEEKTHDTFFYDEDLTNTCKGPLVSEGDLATNEEIGVAYQALGTEYMRLFLDRDTDVFLINEEDEKIFDPFINTYLVRVIAGEFGNLRRNFRGFNTHDVDIYTIFSYILDSNLMKYTVPTTSFSLLSRNGYVGKRSSMYLKYTIIDWFVDSEGTTSFVDHTTLSHYAGTIDIDGTPTLLIPDTTNGEYVVSDGFYDGVHETILEIELNKLINSEALDLTNLISLAESFKLWSQREKFYMGAILLTLLKIGGSAPC